MTKGTYALVTLAYWAFMLTDGALRMIVLLHFHELGYSPVQLAFLFLLYECAGIVTNLIGGWVGSRYGLRRTLFIGLSLQIVALLALSSVSDTWHPYLTVGFVMAIQALAGVAKDLTKMSSKSAVKLVINDENADAEGKLFKWVAALTGSKNALKGVGFFLGSLLLAKLGFDSSLYTLAGMLAIVLIVSLCKVKGSFGKSKQKTKFTQLFSKSPAINKLSFARAFLFASRDVWFVVGLPIFLHDVLHWDFWQVGGFMAFWVIGYGFVQALAPKFTRLNKSNPDTSALAHCVHSAKFWIFALSLLCATMAMAVSLDFHLTYTLLGGLCVFGFIFAINSSLHSYLILAYTDDDSVSLNVGFYYMANACGRLLGTLLSGAVYLWAGLPACLWTAAGLTLVAAFTSLKLPKTASARKPVAD
ncbi:organoarsenical effux MFS transporter ArsJ [Rubritalea tangerina]|uniref:Organoarsenical effux MFS transporter ArsJ n=1 Tax=Rubritalea tangerina TaxID=430798 RepID=A0ABW4ZCM0_9BACT